MILTIFLVSVVYGMLSGWFVANRWADATLSTSDGMLWEFLKTSAIIGVLTALSLIAGTATVLAVVAVL